MCIELDKTFNTHKNKTSEGQAGVCMACSHDVTKNHREEEWESTKRIPEILSEVTIVFSDTKEEEIQKRWGDIRQQDVAES